MLTRDKKLAYSIVMSCILIEYLINSGYFYRATHMHRTDYAVARCLSVRLSVTRRYCV